MKGRFLIRTSVVLALLWNPLGHAADSQNHLKYIACVLNEGKGKADSVAECEGSKGDGLDVLKAIQDPPKGPTPACPVNGYCGHGVTEEGKKIDGSAGKEKIVPNLKEMKSGYKGVMPGSKSLPQ